MVVENEREAVSVDKGRFTPRVNVRYFERQILNHQKQPLCAK